MNLKTKLYVVNRAGVMPFFVAETCNNAQW